MNMISLTTNQVKAIELDILKAFAAYCDLHGLKYFLAYGTLIGAVRHKGFIPWDDDIDVLMLRDDYERFSELMKEREINSHLEWKSIENGKYHAPFGKVIDTRTVSDIYGRGLDDGLWIDIFPIDNYTEECMKKNTFWRKVFIAKDTKCFALNKKGIGKFITKLIFFWISKETIVWNNRMRAVNTPESGLYANMLWEAYPQKAFFTKEMFASQAEVIFEGHTFKTVADVDGFLNRCYGNYMQLPPENKRVAHYVKAYWVSDEKMTY